MVVLIKKKPEQQKKNKWDSIKINNFCPSKDIMKNVKRQRTEWKNLFANYISHKCLISRMYKEPLQHNKKTNNPIFKRTKT